MPPQSPTRLLRAALEAQEGPSSPASPRGAACLHDALRAASGMVDLNGRAATELQLQERLAEKLQVSSLVDCY